MKKQNKYPPLGARGKTYEKSNTNNPRWLGNS